MPLKKCLIIDQMHDSIISMLREIGWEASYQPDISRDEIKRIHPHYTGLIVRGKTKIDYDLLGNNPTITFVGRAGAGVDNLDLDYLSKKNIEVIHAAEGNRDAVGEHTIGILLSLLRNISRADQQVRSHIWKREENRGTEIMDKTVGIVGYGNMGRAFAKRLSGFGCKVLAYDKYISGYSDSYAEEVDMQRLFKEADMISLHVPLTSETKGMVNEGYLSQFKKDIVLINTSRGEIVVQRDLAESLKSGKVKGAALDVLENERLSEMTPSDREIFNILVQQTNVIFTPHIAGWTVESHRKINVALINKIKAWNG
jgi:D-3-phosphoglycerate dehydrogenase